MNPILREYVLKGLYLGLWAYLAIVQEPLAPEWPRFQRVLMWVAGGFGLGLLAGAIIQILRGYKPAANLKAFPIVVLLESSYPIYIGILGGLALGAFLEYDPRPDRDWLGYCALGGALLGYGFFQLRTVRDFLTRFVVALLVGGALLYLGIHYLFEIPGFDTPAGQHVLGIVILCGLPGFYLLTFCGEAEESEVEIAALCAAFGIGIYEVFAGQESMIGKAIFLVPLIAYFVYVTRLLPFLQVFKHVLRGYTALNLERPVEAVRSFKRALVLNPNDDLARRGMWTLHESIDVSRLASDSPLLQHLDFGFCLDQAQAYLIGSRTPTVAERDKAGRMLDLVEKQQPKLAARVDYLRAVSQTYAKQFDEAAATLSRLLDPETPYMGNIRNAVLFDAWGLALWQHPELAKRLGEAELSKPGRRMQAIAAAERTPDSGDAKAFFYSGLTEAEFAADAASDLPTDFNYEYCEQLGLALINEPNTRERGMAFLRIAGRGLLQRGATIFTRLADLADQYGEVEAARGYREQVKRAGLAIGVKAMAGEERSLYFAAVKKLATDAEARSDYENAIGDYRLLLESRSGELETYRKLADLYEKHRDDLNALLMTETALVYSGNDKDLLERKDRYYAFVTVERLQGVKDQVKRFFDAAYCATKAKQILDMREPDVETLDWGLHLTRLARVIQPADANLRLLEARALLRKGERDAALAALEDLRETKPSGSSDDAWYQATKILGDLYVNELNRPDLAVHCYLDYRDYSKSGADTYYNAAKCYEAMGETKNAVKFYEMVTAYEQHPKYWDAKSAIDRLK